MHFTQRLRDLREDKDLNQENIAQILEITQQQYQLYESGKRELKIHHLVKLCKYYNVSADYILCLTDDPNPIWKK
ncbi:MAG: helix-turn-helix transcriptional regulator [Clostridia bacterium]|nr:helix-turn-helix transcriptional regulator [Clostridia bacterium]